MSKKKFSNIQDYLISMNLMDRCELKDMMLRSALFLLGDCAHNFGGDASVTEKVAEPFRIFNEILDCVE